jgi:hypothetical protein
MFQTFYHEKREGDCYTPLHCACAQGNLEVAKFLIVQAGASVNSIAEVSERSLKNVLS